MDVLGIRALESLLQIMAVGRFIVQAADFGRGRRGLLIFARIA